MFAYHAQALDSMEAHAYDASTQKAKEEGSTFKVHPPQLHSKFKVSLGYKRPWHPGAYYKGES